MTTTVLAWQWHGCLSWLSTSLHALGAFMTSAGFGGLAALGAAVVAADQVRKTRSNDNERHERDWKREALWERFEWTMDQTRAGSDGKRTLSLGNIQVMLKGMLTRVDELNDAHLKQLIEQVHGAIVTAVLKEYLERTAATGKHHAKTASSGESSTPGGSGG